MNRSFHDAARSVNQGQIFLVHGKEKQMLALSAPVQAEHSILEMSSTSHRDVRSNGLARLTILC